MNKLKIVLLCLTAVIGAVGLPASAMALPRACVDCGDRHAPGPIAAAGAPVLLLGYGAYWLIKRRRRGE